jgi:hypothetical protein
MNKNLPTKIKYLTNKDLLEEIHLSKSTYCEFIDPKYSNYDIIVDNLGKVTQDLLNDVRKRKVTQETIRRKKEMISKGIKNPVINFTLDDIPQENIVIRLMTFDHIPINEERIHKAKTEAEKHIKCNFPPFQHFIIKEGEFYIVGKSHWQGGIENGWFNIEHGKMTNRLALMFMKLVERYGHRGNWRGYCVDETTEALTQRGWLGIDDINETDIILSYDEGNLKWSKIKSIFRDHFDGLMHNLTVTGMDALITPNHKLVTGRGLIEAEYLLESDKVILMGNEIQSDSIEIYNNDIVELLGWIVTEGCYEWNEEHKIKRITIYQNPGDSADRIRSRLTNLNFKFSESLRLNNICFAISRPDSRKIIEILPTKNLNMNFLLSLTANQRNMLVNTMIDGDGWRVGNYRRYTQKNKECVDMFQILCTMSGIKTNSHYIQNHKSFGKLTSYYNINLFSKRRNNTKVECIDFHGGKRNGKGLIGRGKITHPNEPTTYYNGMVWCPETEYGCFIARRNGKVYLTGNTYLDEMKNQALLQLSQIGLQFDESRSAQPNPFSYYTQVLANSFTRVLNIEKKNQNIRDDLLTMHGANPSYTRTTDNEIAAKKLADTVVKPPEA